MTTTQIDRRRPGAIGFIGTAAGAAGVALLPKCPMCIAGYLVAFGLGANAALWAANLAGPAAWGLTGAGLTYALIRCLRGSRRPDDPIEPPA